MTIRVLTPEGVTLETAAESAVLPALDGALGVMSGHRPLIAGLAGGTLWYRIGGEEHTFPLPQGGTAEVRDDVITVLTA